MCATRRKQKKMSEPERWIRQAIRLIKTGGRQWTQRELDQSANLQRTAYSWLNDKRSYDSRKYRSLFRELEKTHKLAEERLKQKSRGTGEQMHHPERNVITEFKPASGRGRWATPKVKR